MRLLVQDIIVPSIGLCTDESLYYHAEERVFADLNSKEIHVPKNAVISFDSFFNSLSVKKWKENTTIDNLLVTYKVRGKGCLYINHFNDSKDEVLEQIIIDNDEGEVQFSLSGLHTGYIYLRWRAFEESVIESFSFYTSSPCKDVKLGLVITTFNREEQVVKSVKRIRDELLTDPRYVNKIQLYLINNGNDVDGIDYPEVNIVKNKNLGGAGGFSRGLCELTDEGTFTHCIFMDDDAACEIDSIRRTFALLSLSNDDNLAVSAAMLYEERPRIVHEAGAVVFCDGIFHRPAKIGLNVSERSGIISFDEEEALGYGAWWFYAFNIKNTKYYPFPFFVRGDDMLFGLMNDNHKIITLNGIASWQMDFNRKLNPLVFYLSFRAMFMSSCRKVTWRNRIMLSAFFMREVIILSMANRYESAQAVVQAYKDCMSGIDFWENNVDCAEVRKKINQLTINERFNIPSSDLLKIETDSFLYIKENKIHKALRYLTLNGHLIPKYFFNKRARLIPETHKNPTNMVFMRNDVYYVSQMNGSVMKLSHSKEKFFRVVLNASLLSFNTLFSLKKRLESYQSEITQLTTKDFWKTKF